VNDEDERRIIHAAFDRAHISPAPGFEARMRASLERAGRPQPIHKHPPPLREGLAVPRGIALLAVGLAVVLVLALVASRVALRPTRITQPGANGGVPLPADAFPCSLAVEAISNAQNPGQSPATSVSLGFINIPAGGFQVDPAATVVGLPVDPISGQNSYSAALKRWVPASTQTISPDGLSYTYVKLLPAGATLSNATSSEVHVFDLVKNADRKVWSGSSNVQLVSWDSAGILFAVWPLRGGAVLLWRIDPATGAISQAPMDADPTSGPTPALLGGGPSSYLGSDRHGQDVYWLGTRDTGTKYSIVVVTSGRVTTLYSGIVGDSMDFDPFGVYSDAHGLWLGNLGGSRVWLWSQSSGLRSFPVTGLPPPPSGYAFARLDFHPAGVCVPGTFAGVAAPGLPPATTPTPSPSPPQVDWAPLIAKPLNLQQLSSGAPCPVSPQVDLVVTTNGPKTGGPNYGFGQGPVYVSGQTSWYAGTQGIDFLTDPKYTGPVLVRSIRLDGTGSLTLSGQGATTLANGAIGLAETSSPPYWGMWLGVVTPSAAGCYGIQFDGTSFSSSAVIAVSPGPVPAG
jgi:hypothetical protein